MVLVVFIGLLLVLFLIGMPVAFSMGFTSFVLMLMDGNIQYANMAQRLMGGINSFVILAVPLFLLAGKLLNTGGITDRIFDFCKVCVGFLPGGMGHVNVTSSVIFSGMSGTAVSDAAGLGQIEIKAMRDAGYGRGFSSAITAASSTIGPIIPPSLPMVIYGVAAGASVGALFLAGVIPGLLMGVAMMLLVSYFAKKRDFPREARPTWPVFFRALRRAFLPLLTPVIIIGGIYKGIFTPTEAAVVAVLYAFFLAGIVYRELTWKSLVQVLRETARDSAIIGIIISMATIYGNVIMRQRIPMEVLDFFTSFADSALILLLVLNLFLLIVGAFMETIAAITILTPIILPLLNEFGIDPVHFGIIMVLNLMIGLLTPPFGIVLFVISKIGGIGILQLIRELIPFYLLLIAVLLIITLFPDLVLWLPKLMTS
ncbi:tripartite ATP-independent transporter DctM subunit [Caldalkalibacillus uzonensis]|uniref:Tripartite ATP-independent transporter DctM subunit n=1 Tax=Caldalkalibacillus uzonensis TaxID=353224 RepID=A0ABU0CPE5_9BACI|nr:TRAP transporter large permease [Caldalkalibacillus uzonensis]MDQ0338286.1 tripartite ATP-independent transporter DctM subunit [Caldalkalibacillus uzonensis]